jgi:restriction system protein
MPIPAYQTIMLPLLELAGDDRTHTSLEAIEHIAGLYRVSAEERKQLLPSGTSPLLNNRTHWALTYLRHGGLLQSEGRGKFRITPRGLDVLKARPAAIDKALLSQFPGFNEFAYGPGATSGKAPSPVSDSAGLNPEEALEATYREIRKGTESDLLERLRIGDPTFFEKAVLDVLVGMDYGGSRADAARHLGRSGDEGLDGVINEDELGLDKIFVQAKRYKRTVGREDVAAFAGSLDSAHARKGVMFTTSTFSPDAQAFVAKIEKRIVLIDGESLVRLMVDHGIGVQTKAVFRLYRVDDAFFDIEG